MAVTKIASKPSRATSTFDSQHNCIERKRGLDEMIDLMRRMCMPDNRDGAIDIGVTFRIENGEIVGHEIVNKVVRLSRHRQI